jgi:hypothetical protein
MIRKILILFTLTLSHTVFAAGGNVNGVIKGEVLDSSGSPVSGAEVTISNPSTGYSKTISTDADGSFYLSVQVGTFNVSASKSGVGTANAESVPSKVGTATEFSLTLTSGEEVVQVLGQQTARDYTVGGSALNLSLEEVSILPVARNIESVALLAPGTVRSDVDFGEEKTLVAMGGSSVAENVYYINGMNVTNFRNGLGGSSVPFEFYRDFQIKTGGYSAEFGRSTGGVINAVTKRGTNDIEYGVVGYYTPKALGGSTPDTYFEDGEIYDHNSDNATGSYTTDLYFGGPIIKDKLFIYALYEFQKTDEEFTTRNTVNQRNEREIDDNFWGIDLFWQINSDHSLELTAFSDKRSRDNTIYGDYDYESDSHGPDFLAITSELRGGENFIARYDGQLTDSLSLSVLYGENEYDLEDRSTAVDTCPNVINSSSLDIPFFASCSGDFLVVDLGGDKREAFRIDAEWQLGNHLIRFGLDNETNTTELTTAYPSNSHYYRYYEAPPGTELNNGGVIPDANGDGSDVIYVRDRFLSNGGAFETLASAYYIEDVWEVNDFLTASIGLRNETFDNKNADGGSFIKLDDQWAPRIGIEYDLFANASTVLFANWGRYHLPVANNTNARLAGNETFTEEYFLFDGGIDSTTNAPTSVDADGRVTSTQIGPTTVLADGSVPDVREIVDSTIEPMYQDEIILGIRQSLTEDLSLTARYIDRELSSTIDDIQTTTGHYILTNPGTDVTYWDDFNGDGNYTEGTVTAEELGYPKASRTYKALELVLEKAWNGKWNFNTSYVYSESEGNTEGLVKSDNGQDDAGITTDFDYPQLMDGAQGPLPNDREHQLKAWGNYQLFEKVRLGASMIYSSGRPINRFGVGHPDGNPSYGATYYTYDLETETHTFHPRGSAGRTDNELTFNLNAVYETMMFGGDLELRMDIFNLFDADSSVEVFENAETSAPGVYDDRYGLTTSYQSPREVRFGASLRF